MQNKNPDLLKDKGDKALAAGHREEAEDWYRKAFGAAHDKRLPIASTLADAIAEMMYEDTATRPEAYRDALYFWRQAVLEDPADRTALEHLMKEYFVLARGGAKEFSFTDVEKTADTLVGLDQKNATAYMDRGLAVLLQLKSTEHTGKRFEQAQADLRKAVELAPDNTDAMMALSTFELEYSAELTKQFKAEEGKKMRAAALDRLQSYKTKNPKSVDARINYASALLRAKDDATALDELQAAANDLPTDDRICEALAEYYNRPDTRNLSEREKYLTKAVELNPGRIDLLGALAEAYEMKASVAAQEAARAVPPGDADAARAVLEDWKRNWNKAITAYVKLLDDKGSVKGAQALGRQAVLVYSTNNLCWAYLELADKSGINEPDGKAALAKAFDLMDKIQRVRPTDAVLKLFQGRVKLMQGLIPDATMLLTQADLVFSGGNPNDPNWNRTKRLLVDAFTKAGMSGDAIKYLDQLLHEQPKDAQLRLRRSALQLTLMRYREAYDGAIAAIPGLGENQKAGIQTALASAEGLLRSGTIKADERPGLINAIAELRSKLGGQAVNTGLARDLVMSGESQKAIEILKPVVEAEPDNADARSLLVTALLQQAAKYDDVKDVSRADDCRAEAKTNLDTLTAKYPNEPRFKWLTVVAKSPHATIDEIQRELIGAIDDKYDQELSWATYYAIRNKIDEQLQHLKAAEAVKPDDATLIDRIFQVLIAKKDWDGAQEYQQKAETKNIDGVNGKFFQGQLELARDHVGPAINILKSAVALRPEFSMGQTLLGKAYLVNGQIPEALDAYNKAVEQSPNNVTAMKGLIQIYYSRHDAASIETAADYLSKALAFAPRDPELWAFRDAIGDPKDAIKRREAMRLTDPKDIDNLQRLAVDYLRDGQQAKAIETYKPVYDANSDNLVVADNYATMLRNAGKSDDAMQIYQKFVTSDKNDVRFVAYIMLGDSNRTIGQLESAEKYYGKAIEEKPEKANTQAERKLADMLFESGQFAKAEGIYKTLVDLTDKKDPRVLNRYVEAMVRQGNAEHPEKFDQADKLLTGEILKNNPKDQESLVLLGFLRMSQRKGPEAEKVFSDVLAVNPNNTNAHYYHALLQVAMQLDLTVASQDLQVVRRLDPNNTKSRELLARVYRQTNRYPDAVQEYHDILELQPDYSQARLEYAQFLLGLVQSDMKIPRDAPGDYPQVLRQIKPEETLNNLLTDSIKRFPDQPVWRIVQGNLAEMLGKNDIALNIYSQVWNMEKQSASAAVPMLNLLLKAKNFEKVVLYTNDMIPKNPDLLDLRIKRADALIGENNQKDALVDFTYSLDNTVKNVPGYLAVAHEMGTVLPFDVVTDVLQQRLTADPKHIPTRLALAQLQQGNKKFDLAAATMKPLLNDPEAAPVKTIVLRVLALAAYESGRFEESAGYYQTLQELLPDDMETLNNLAFVLADELKKPKEGLPFAERAVKILKLAPGETAMLNNGNVYDTFGWVKFLNGDLPAAEKALRQSLDTDSETALTYYHLARVLQAQKRLAEAKDTLGRCLKLATDKDTVLPKAQALMKELGG